MRALTNEERHAILGLAAEFASDVQRGQLLADLSGCTVHEKVPDGSLLAFEIPGYERPGGHKQGPYRGKGGFPVEGVMKDVDGAEISVYLFGDANDRVYEFELDKHAIAPIIRPDWSTFKVK